MIRNPYINAPGVKIKIKIKINLFPPEATTRAGEKLECMYAVREVYRALNEWAYATPSNNA